METKRNARACLDTKSLKQAILSHLDYSLLGRLPEEVVWKANPVAISLSRDKMEATGLV